MIYELKLRNAEGKETIHTKDFISSKNLLNALKLNNQVFEDEEEQVLALVDFVAGLFDIKADEIFEGLDAHDLMREMYDIFYKVLGWGEKKRQTAIAFQMDGETPEIED